MIVRLPEHESEKHGLGSADGVEVVPGMATDTDLAVVLGGDGTILSSMRAFAGSGTTTFAINFGEIGFLATVDELEDGIARLLTGDYENVSMPALSVTLPDGEVQAAGDVSFHRLAGNRVAHLSYWIDGEELGQVRCDGLVAATPVGSTGYNLANGGPLLAWGVSGFVISFIAPHSLTARPLVAAPDAVLVVANRSKSEELEVATDGRPVGLLEPGAEMEVRFVPDAMLLAQVRGSSFHHRLREKFGRIAY